MTAGLVIVLLPILSAVLGERLSSVSSAFGRRRVQLASIVTIGAVSLAVAHARNFADASVQATAEPDYSNCLCQSWPTQHRPAWSPDGKWLAFSSARGGYKDEAALHPHNPQPYGDLFVMRADGSDVRQLTDDQFEDGTVTFVPTLRR